MKKDDISRIGKIINQLNKKIHRAEKQGDHNKVWRRTMKLSKLKEKLTNILRIKN